MLHGANVRGVTNDVTQLNFPKSATKSIGLNCVLVNIGRPVLVKCCFVIGVAHIGHDQYVILYCVIYT